MSTTTIEIIIVDGMKESQFVKKIEMRLFARIINGNARRETVMQAHNKTSIIMLLLFIFIYSHNYCAYSS